VTDQLANFKKPDRAGGLVLMGVVGLGILYAFYLALPTLIMFAQDTIYFGVEIAVGVVLAMFLFSRDFWSGIFYASQNLIRKMRRAIVREDPIGVLDTVIGRFETKQAEIADAMVQADAARKRQANSIGMMEKKSVNEQQLAKEAQRQSRADVEVSQHLTAAQRWQSSADEMKPMATMLDKMQQSLEQARDLCTSKLEDLKNQKEVLAVKLDAMQASSSAVKRFKNFFGSNPDLQMQIMAVDEIERQCTQDEAELDQFMRQINPVIQSADLQKQADAQAALQKFGNFLKPALSSGPVVDGHVVAVKESVRK